MIRKAKCILEMGSGVKFAFCTPECPAYRHKDNCLYLDSLAFINKNESLQGTQIGEKKSIDDIIVENYHFIKKYCEKLAKNQHIAEDICQEVLKKVFENKHRIKPDQPIIPWLLKAARNALIDYYRKEKLRTVESIDASEQGALDRSFERCETMELASLLALGTLTSQQRKALELVYVEGMSYLEAAEAMGLSYKGFYSLLKRAQEKLKKKFQTLFRPGVLKEILNGLKITNTARKHLYIAFVSAALSLLSLLAVFLLFADLIYVFQESVWDEFHEIKERIAKQEPSQDLIVVEYDLQSYKKLGPLEGNIDLWRKTILRIAESAKAVAIDCGIGPEDVQEIPPFRLKEIPVNVVFPLHAYGISTRGNVITAVSWKPLCIDYFRNASLNYGHTVYFIDSDGIARKVPSQILVGNDTKPALSIAALRIFGRKDIKIVEAGGNSLLLAGKKRVLLERGLTFRPEFIPYERFKRISFAEVAGGDFPYETLKGKLVLVGINLPNWGLQYLYPLSKQKLSSSLVLQANIVNSLMKGNIYTVQPKSLFVLLVCFTVVILSVVYSRTNVLTSTVVAISSLVAWELFCLVQYLRYTLVDPILVPFGIITSFAFAHALMHAQEAKEKHMVESIFSRYLKPEIVKRIVENPEKALETLKGTTRLATVLFADIRGFTTFCENRKPEEVVRTLNEIFEVTTEMIFSEDGMIDKFIGDGVMVLFNIPDDQEDHADRAVRAAIKIMKALEERKSGLSFGIGINTGVVVAGNIGSSKRMEYTAIGDVVNTASRICSVAGKGEILISEHTKKMLNDGFRLEDAGEYALKGKSGKLRLFRVIYDYN